MNDVSEPLLRINGGKASDPVLTPQNIHQITFEMTEAGDSVLKGEADFIEVEWYRHVARRGPSSPEKKRLAVGRREPDANSDLMPRRIGPGISLPVRKHALSRHADYSVHDR